MATHAEQHRLASLIARAEKIGRLDELLRVLLTPTERETIEMRLKIIDLLLQGTSQHDIAKRLGVGIGTVTRGARELKAHPFFKEL